jgi:hypothetical protein
MYGNNPARLRSRNENGFRADSTMQLPKNINKPRRHGRGYCAKLYLNCPNMNRHIPQKAFDSVALLLVRFSLRVTL